MVERVLPTHLEDVAVDPATPSTIYALSGSSGENAFALKLTPDGSAIAYSTPIGGSGRDLAWDIAVDATGHAYIAGFTWSMDFPTTSGENGADKLDHIAAV